MTGVFDRHDAGTAEPAWRELLAGLPRLDPPGRGDHVVVVSAHPDDETLGVGGLLAQAAAAGARITVLVASNGEASHPQSPTHSPADLASRRRDEVARALALLAPGADLRLLDLPDGRLAEHEAQLTSAVDDAAGGATHLLTTWIGDRHPDHAACARAGAAAAARRGLTHWQYPIWAWHWAVPDGDDLPVGRLRAVPVPAPVSPVKQAALACFTSHYLPLS